LKAEKNKKSKEDAEAAK